MIDKMRTHGFAIVLIGLAFGLIETLYFGSNWHPESIAELKCDYVTAEICGAGMGIMFYSFFLNVKQNLKALK